MMNDRKDVSWFTAQLRLIQQYCAKLLAEPKNEDFTTTIAKIMDMATEVANSDKIDALLETLSAAYKRGDIMDLASEMILQRDAEISHLKNEITRLKREIEELKDKIWEIEGYNRMVKRMNDCRRNDVSDERDADRISHEMTVTEYQAEIARLTKENTRLIEKINTVIEILDDYRAGGKIMNMISGRRIIKAALEELRWSP